MNEIESACKSGLLSTRAKNCLLAERYYTKSAVMAATDTELLKLPGMGRTSLNEIKRWLGIDVAKPRTSPIAIRWATTLLRNNGYVVYLKKRKK